jgi:hypothetical protein
MADNAIQVVAPSTALAKPETFAPRTLQEALQFADLLIESKMLPKSYLDKPPAAIVVAIQFGMELGMQPMQSLQNIANINGQPGVWGDAALALVLNSGLCEYYEEDDFETIKKKQTAVFVIKRRGFPKAKTTTFSYEDAKTAGIFTNAVWKTYPYRMCQMRARSFGLRGSFPDVLKGMELAEALQDYPGTTIEAEPQRSTPAAAAEQKPAAEEAIGQSGGSDWYKKYKSNGYTPEEAKKWLADNLQIGPPHNEKNSKDIPVSKKDAAFAWANTPSPIKVACTEAFDLLGFKPEERVAFFDQHKNFPAVHEALLAEAQKRDAAERGE